MLEIEELAYGQRVVRLRAYGNDFVIDHEYVALVCDPQRYCNQLNRARQIVNHEYVFSQQEVPNVRPS